MWDDIATWFQSPAGARVLQTAIVPALAILVAGVLAALIGRAAAKSVLARGDRDQAVSAVAALVESARVAADPESARDGRRRVARLRTEADVRMRLLPLPGAGLAADWAATRIDALQQDDASSGDAVAEVRDRLVEWSRRPGRAKRLFASTPAVSPKRQKQEEAPQTSEPRAERLTAAQRPAQQAAPDGVGAGVTPVAPATSRFSRPAAAEAAPSAAAAAPAPSPAPATPVVPAWQRTRAGEQLREQREGRVQPVDEDPEPATAPVKVPHAHRAQESPTPAADPARPAEPSRAEAPRPTQAPAAKKEQPAWLDDYDDEAQVTQNLTFKTPPPIAATSVRDRRPTGQDIVPRG